MERWSAFSSGLGQRADQVKWTRANAGVGVGRTLWRREPLCLRARDMPACVNTAQPGSDSRPHRSVIRARAVRGRRPTLATHVQLGGRALTVETRRAVCATGVWHWAHTKAHGGPACATGSSCEVDGGDGGEGSLDMASQGLGNVEDVGVGGDKSRTPFRVCEPSWLAGLPEQPPVGGPGQR